MNEHDNKRWISYDNLFKFAFEKSLLENFLFKEPNTQYKSLEVMSHGLAKQIWIVWYFIYL